MRKKTVGWLGAWAVMTVLAGWAFHGIAWDEALAAVRSADPVWFGLAVAGNSTIMILASWQWIFLLPRRDAVGFPTMFWITAVTSTVSNGGPFLAGHAAGIHLLASRGGVGHAAAVSVKALEQLIEGMAKLSLVAVTLFLVPLPVRLRAAAITLTILVPILGVALLLAAGHDRVLDRWAAGAEGWRRTVLLFLSEAAEQLEAMRRPSAFIMALALGMAQKVAEGLAILAVLAALHIDLPFWAIFLSLTAVNLSTMASVTPANVGVYEASALLAYRAAGMPLEVALGVAVLQHLAYLIPMAGVGWIALAMTGLKKADLPTGTDTVGPP